MAASIAFTDFYKEYNEFEEMSLDSKYNKMKKFTNFLTNFKILRRKNQKRDSKRNKL